MRWHKITTPQRVVPEDADYRISTATITDSRVRRVPNILICFFVLFIEAKHNKILQLKLVYDKGYKSEPQT